MLAAQLVVMLHWVASRYMSSSVVDNTSLYNSVSSRGMFLKSSGGKIFMKYSEFLDWKTRGIQTTCLSANQLGPTSGGYWCEARRMSTDVFSVSDDSDDRYC